MQILATETLKQLPAAILPRLIAIFTSTTPELLVEIQQAATKDDLPGMAQAAHKLKGSCVSLGAEKMADLCKTLQDKGEANDEVDVQGYIAELNNLYPATLAAMQNV
ncbi:MAG: Hpt domain-containing protein [Thiolinea sp.]